jgi:hypothetical protein
LKKPKTPRFVTRLEGSSRRRCPPIVEHSGASILFQIRRGEVQDRAPQPLERDAYVLVDDLGSLHAHLTKHGADIQSPPTRAPYGISEMVVEDLNGCRIAFGQR